MRLFDYTGVIHLHSEYSLDGRIAIDEIMQAAAEARVDFLMLTDHETLKARETGEEGWHGPTLLVVGEEISPLRLNHFLVFGMEKSLGRHSYRENYLQELVDTVREAGGIGLIAHPDHEGTKKFHVKQFSWQRWDVRGYAGMGIWDFMTDWQSTLKGYATGFFGYFFPALVLRGPKSVTLRRWDSLNREGKVVGFGELDNHDSTRVVFGHAFSIFPFRKAFHFVRTHILLEQPFSGDGQTDIALLLDALKRGRAYACLEYFASTKGFEFTISDGLREATMGDDFLLRNEATAEVILPEKGRIRVIRDGALFAESAAVRLRTRITQEGIYRVEIFLKRWGKYRPWIFTNPVFVRS